ncbi:PREDICTED: zinc phosphodiesterase ELAC protein 2-like [Priapulus caudatus]|uniref:ribonuclease Z n=1 Tax=Priapulus caudatus TaxID=37621 RepID=A0ABM1EN65_PRICU|nr:PREDICTED: zinc phosphodiesterase ELAC protein 2-like [Priapulus caudatus]
MEDDLIDEARRKAHSTTSQAIEVGRKMNAKFIMLNHFSQRYSKVPLFSDDFTSNVGVSFDNMRVRPRDLPLLPLFPNPLRAMFADHYEEMEGKRTKRQVRKQLEMEEKKLKQR